MRRLPLEGQDGISHHAVIVLIYLLHLMPFLFLCFGAILKHVRMRWCINQVKTQTSQKIHFLEVGYTLDLKLWPLDSRGSSLSPCISTDWAVAVWRRWNSADVWPEEKRKPREWQREMDEERKKNLNKKNRHVRGEKYCFWTYLS